MLSSSVILRSNFSPTSVATMLMRGITASMVTELHNQHPSLAKILPLCINLVNLVALTLKPFKISLIVGRVSYVFLYLRMTFRLCLYNFIIFFDTKQANILVKIKWNIVSRKFMYLVLWKNKN